MDFGIARIPPGAKWRLQTSIFNIQPYAQKDPDSNEIFVMGAAQHAAPMTKILLLLWSFCAYGWTLKIDVCKNLQGQIEIW